MTPEPGLQELLGADSNYRCGIQTETGNGEGTSSGAVFLSPLQTDQIDKTQSSPATPNPYDLVFLQFLPDQNALLAGPGGSPII